MYGASDAAQNLGEECADTMMRAGSHGGKAAPCVFYHPEKKIRTYIHGDDCVSVGLGKGLKWLEGVLGKKYGIKTQALGPTKKTNNRSEFAIGY